MDTEFPGVVARPVGQFRNSGAYHYQTLRLNVDMLKLIQLGLTFTDAEGNLPRVNGELCVWQFNFREFRLGDDVHAADSIVLLKASGIDFARNETRGCDARRFGELLTSSGVVCNEGVRWVTFHSGYDFGYLLKVRVGLVVWVAWVVVLRAAAFILGLNYSRILRRLAPRADPLQLTANSPPTAHHTTTHRSSPPRRCPRT